MGAVQGVVVVDKPVGMTSRSVTTAVHQVIAKAVGQPRRQVKAGHIGTLDPLASGVLAIAVGRATRLSDILHEGSKRYLAEFTLGQASQTDDVTSECWNVDCPPLSDDAIDGAVRTQIGAIRQQPPAFSAKKVDGRRAYALSRAGRAVTLESVPVRIDDITVVARDGHSLTLRVDCGTGTYIRSIGRDIAAALGTRAVMRSLVRERSGVFDLSQAAPLQQVRDQPLSVLRSVVQSVGTLMPVEPIGDRRTRDLRNGRPIDLATAAERDRVALVRGDELVAIGRQSGRTVQPKLVFPA